MAHVVQHLDLRVTREVFGNIACVQFGAAVDRLAVSLDDDRELHCSGVAGGSAGDGSWSGPARTDLRLTTPQASAPDP